MNSIVDKIANDIYGMPTSQQKLDVGMTMMRLHKIKADQIAVARQLDLEHKIDEIHAMLLKLTKQNGGLLKKESKGD